MTATVAQTFFDFYANNPVGVIDQNLWDDKTPEVIMNFQKGPTIYTPLIQWTTRSQETGALNSQFTELIEGDVTTIPFRLRLNTSLNLLAWIHVVAG